MTSTDPEWLSNLGEKLRVEVERRMGGVPEETRSTIPAAIENALPEIGQELRSTDRDLPGSSSKGDRSLDIQQFELMHSQTPPRFSVLIGCRYMDTLMPDLPMFRESVTVRGTIDDATPTVTRA